MMSSLTNRFIFILIFILTCLFLSSVQIGYASYVENGEGSDDARESYSKSIGTFSAGLLSIGFFYVILTRSYVLIRKYVDKKSYPKVIEVSKIVYTNLRKPLFYLHVLINIIAIFFGVYHGLLVEVKSELQANLGWLAIIIMITSSVSGFIMWLKLRPIWNNKDIRSVIRTSHRQWILSFLLIIILLIHVSFGEVH